MENINDDHKNIVRIIFEYKDKTLVYWGKDAKELKKAIDGMTVFCAIHGTNPFDKLKLSYKTELTKKQ